MKKIQNCKEFKLLVPAGLIALLLLLPFLFFACKSKDIFDSEEIVSLSYQKEVNLIENYLQENKFEGSVLVAKNKDIITLFIMSFFNLSFCRQIY